MFPSLILFSTLLLDQADSDAAACPSMQWAEGKETVWSVSGCDTAVLTNEQSCCPKKIFPFPPHDGVYQRGASLLEWSHKCMHKSSPNFTKSCHKVKGNMLGKVKASCNIVSTLLVYGVMWMKQQNWLMLTTNTEHTATSQWHNCLPFKNPCRVSLACPRPSTETRDNTSIYILVFSPKHTMYL